MAIALLTGVIGAPLYHLLTGSPSGDQKHVVFGLLFMLPLIGITIDRALRQWRKALAIPALIGIAAFGAVQLVRIDEGWPDLRAAAAVLDRDVRPGQKLLASSTWVEAAYLYQHGRITSPYDLYDVYRVTHLGTAVDVCSFSWLVEEPGGEPGPPRSSRRCIAAGPSTGSTSPARPSRGSGTT